MNATAAALSPDGVAELHEHPLTCRLETPLGSQGSSHLLASLQTLRFIRLDHGVDPPLHGPPPTPICP